MFAPPKFSAQEQVKIILPVESYEEFHPLEILWFAEQQFTISHSTFDPKENKYYYHFRGYMGLDIAEDWISSITYSLDIEPLYNLQQLERNIDKMLDDGDMEHFDEAARKYALIRSEFVV